MIRILSVGAACGALLLGACGGPEKKAVSATADHVEQIGAQQAAALEEAAKAADAERITFEKQAVAVEDHAKARADEIRKTEGGAR